MKCRVLEQRMSSKERGAIGGKILYTHGEWREPRLWSVHPVVSEPRK